MVEVKLANTLIFSRRYQRTEIIRPTELQYIILLYINMYILDVITETNIHITTRPIPPRQYHSTEQGVARVQKTSAPWVGRVQNTHAVQVGGRARGNDS